MAVATVPGPTPLTVSRTRPSSTARPGQQQTAPFDAQYALSRAKPCAEAVDRMLTMRPLLGLISRAACWPERKTPRALTS